jgi:hypothetical protein
MQSFDVRRLICPKGLAKLIQCPSFIAQKIMDQSIEKDLIVIMLLGSYCSVKKILRPGKRRDVSDTFAIRNVICPIIFLSTLFNTYTKN